MIKAGCRRDTNQRKRVASTPLDCAAAGVFRQPDLCLTYRGPHSDQSALLDWRP